MVDLYQYRHSDTNKMTEHQPLRLLALEGDGIGPEIMAATLNVLHACAKKHGVMLQIGNADIGLSSLKKNGTTLPDATLENAKLVDAVILGPLSTADYPHDTEAGRNPSAEFRKQLDLFANIRPSKTRAGVAAHAKSMDLVIVRENTEGFYADRNMYQGSGEFMPDPDLALAVRKISRRGCERIARVAFEKARSRRRHLTVVHKANVMHLSDGLFLESVDRVGVDYPDVTVRQVIVDAMAALLIRTPEAFDVIVTTNMFGDILSDEAAELAGSLGVAGSVNVGERYALAQAAHGSAPEIAGQNSANPTGLVTSVSLLLALLGQRSQRAELTAMGASIDRAVDHCLADGDATVDLGGRLTTGQFGEAVAVRLT